MGVTFIHSFFDLHVFLYAGYLNTSLMFMQNRYVHHGTAYRQQGVVPEDVWARLGGVCEGCTPFPIKA